MKNDELSNESEQSYNLYCWGFSKYGQTGINLTTYSSIPVKVLLENNEGEDIPFAISAGENISAVVGFDTNFYTFGKNNFGQLGISHSNYTFNPTIVNIKTRIEKIACGADHMLALSNAYIVFFLGI